MGAIFFSRNSIDATIHAAPRQAPVLPVSGPPVLPEYAIGRVNDTHQSCGERPAMPHYFFARSGIRGLALAAIVAALGSALPAAAQTLKFGLAIPLP